MVNPGPSSEQFPMIPSEFQMPDPSFSAIAETDGDVTFQLTESTEKVKTFVLANFPGASLLEDRLVSR